MPKSWSNLGRFRPVQLKAISRNLKQVAREARIVTLVDRFCPEHLDEIKVGQWWVETMQQFLDWFAELDWFPLDHELFYERYEIADQDPPPSYWRDVGDEDDEDEDICLLGMTQSWESPLWDDLALLLVNIPIQSFGIIENEEPSAPFPTWCHDLHKQFPIQLLRALLGDRTVNIPTLKGLFEPGPEFKWGWEHKKAAWRQLYAMNRTDFPEPLCWLPRVALFAVSHTRNVFLDKVFSLEDSPYYWDQPNHIAFLRQQWAEARLYVEQAYIFSGWALQAANLQEVFRLVTQDDTVEVQATQLALPLLDAVPAP